MPAKRVPLSNLPKTATPSTQHPAAQSAEKEGRRKKKEERRKVKRENMENKEKAYFLFWISILYHPTTRAHGPYTTHYYTYVIPYISLPPRPQTHTFCITITYITLYHYLTLFYFKFPTSHSPFLCYTTPVRLDL